MRHELNQIELIEKYLEGRLAERELEDFKLRLLKEENLREEVEVQRLFINGIENAGLKQSLNFIHQTMIESPYSFLVRNWINVLAAGSFCLLLIIASVFAILNNNEGGSQNIRDQQINSNLHERVSNMAIEEDFYFDDPDTLRDVRLKKMPLSFINMSKKFPLAEIKSSYYSLDPDKDTIITGKEGTIISIPKNCFVFLDGTGLNKQYSFELKEAYKRSEILLNDISFSLNNESYGTNGGVFINAKENENQLKLVPGKNINIRFFSSVQEEKNEKKINRDQIIYFKIFNDETEKRLINIPVDVLDYELNYTSEVKDDRYYTTAYADRHMNDKIEGLTNEKYSNTFVSSMQFHYRIEGSLLYGEGEELLDIYLKNIHLKLWEADSLVAEYLKKKAAADCKNYGRLMKAEEYFRWLKSFRFGKTVNIPQLEYRNYHKGQIYNKLPHTREINRLQKWGLTNEEAVDMLNYFKKIYYYKSKFLEARKKNISLDYYYANQGRYVEYEIHSCGQASTQARELNYFFPINKLGWINYEKLPDEKMVSSIKVDIKGLDTSAFAKVYLVFNKINYISVGNWTKKGQSSFELLPSNSTASLIGFSYFNDKIYYGRKEIVTGDLTFIDLQLRPADEKAIREDLSVLDK
jgi:hypothetical protein